MLYSGRHIQVLLLDNNLVELNFNAVDSAVNKFDQLTIEELQEALIVIKSQLAIQGLLLTSSKDTFIVGADITEFTSLFRKSKQQIRDIFAHVHRLFNEIEDLPFATVSIINGLALGGGLEVALATDFRVMSDTAQIGFPEVGLGLCPGFGGTVRATRLIGLTRALDWMTGGKQNKAAVALQLGIVDVVAKSDHLKSVALDILSKVINGDLRVNKRRETKLEAMQVVDKKIIIERTKETNKKMLVHYPAVAEIISLLEKGVDANRNEALSLELDSFVKLAKTEVATSLIGLFINEQVIKHKIHFYSRQASPVEHVAVLGVGMMGSGIAYQSALAKTPVFLKDINNQANELGMSEVRQLLNKHLSKSNRLQSQGEDTLALIQPALSYEGFDTVDVVIEAVAENIKIKAAVLAEVESKVNDSAIITSNTSTISIDVLASCLERPNQFCGMHFFNPVHAMKLVEVVRGTKTSEKTIAAVVAFAKKMGKTPIVVNDCPGFFVNRVLFSYLSALELLIADGVDFVRVDEVMEAFGWPMGPAYLADVIGLDTCWHCQEILSAGFADRMEKQGDDAIGSLYKVDHFGKKNGRGFYLYKKEDDGRLVREVNPSVYEVVKVISKFNITDVEIVERMMVALCMEAVRCLEEGIVETAAEADMGLLYGIGFPRFRGGALRYIDSLSVAGFVAMADKYQGLGALYHPTDKLREMVKKSQSFFD